MGNEDVRLWMATGGKGEHKEAKSKEMKKRMIRRLRGLREGKW
jgi:hypothetical protein